MIASPSSLVPAAQHGASIKLIGYQRGAEGFVRYGTSPRPSLAEWQDYLYLLVHGGVGSGKTRGGAYRALHFMVTWPESFGLVFTPTHDVFRTSTWLSLQEVFAQAGLIEGQHWEFNKTERLLTMLETGAKAFCTSIDDPATAIGQSASWVWLDEAARMPFAAFLNSQKRLRQRFYPHQAFLTTTPTGRQSWLHALFYPERTDPEFFSEIGLSPAWEGPGDGDIRRVHRFADGTEVSSHYRAYPARTLDNPYGGKELYAQIVATHGADSPMARQEAMGSFELVEGLCFSEYANDRHMVAEEEWPVPPRSVDRVVAGVDFGYAAPAAIVVEGIDSAGRRYLLDEFYRSGCSERELIMAARRLKQAYGIRFFYADPADPRWLQAFRHAGLRTLRANKKRGDGSDPSFGIGLCAWALNHPVADGQSFYVSPKCRRWRAEIENYVREEVRVNRNPRELPRQKGDHAMDAWRYAEMGIAHLWDRPSGRRPRSVTSIRTEVVL